MAILPHNLELVKQMLPHVAARPVEMLCLGYPDIIVPAKDIRTIFGDTIADAVTYRDDSEQVLKWHSMDSSFGKIPETFHFFSLLDVRVTIVDIVSSRGGELIVDLNQPVAPEFHNKFDIVLDAGTLEHCFNIGQGMMNVLQMAKVGGFIHHDNPFFMPNHGFFNLNPTFYNDFYIDNGHIIVASMNLVIETPEGKKFVTAPATSRFTYACQRANIAVVARKLNANPVKWPMQTKYKANPTLKA